MVYWRMIRFMIKEPPIVESLFNHQKIAVEFIMNGFKENRGMFNFCDTGTGKTVIALTVIKMFSAKTGKILIVCPNSTRAMWK